MSRSLRQEHHQYLKDAQEIAEVLYKNHNPIGIVESGLFLMWFSVFVEISKSNVNLSNKRAWAGAMEYVWYKASNEKVSQQEIAKRYDTLTSNHWEICKISAKAFEYKQINGLQSNCFIRLSR